MTIKKLKKLIKKYDDDAEVNVEMLTEFGYHTAYKGTKNHRLTVDKEKSDKKHLVLRQV